MKNKLLNELARNTVGDGKRPNLFFVSAGSNVKLVTDDFNVAYKYWDSISHRPYNNETTLEDRYWGTICSVDPVREGSTCLVRYDDSAQYRVRYGIRA